MSRIIGLLAVTFVLFLTGCAQSVPFDYTAFKQSKPKSILVLPADNATPDVKASHSLVSQVAYPLAESGYYVFPVAVVEETFRQNGLSVAQDIHSISLDKLQKIFGADAVLYLKIEEYGTTYKVISSDTKVTASAKLIDLRTGQQLWSGRATASSDKNQSSGGLLSTLVTTAVRQVANTITDASYGIAGLASNRLLTAGNKNSILYGPRSAQHGTEKL